MQQHSMTYEQYCWVKQKNIVLEETVFHNGTKKVRCTSYQDCTGDGGCRNNALSWLWDKRLSFCAAEENNAAED